MEVTLRSRLARSAAIYSAAWITGAVLLSALHVAFPPRVARTPADPSTPVIDATPVSDPVSALSQGPVASAHSPLPTHATSETDVRVLARKMQELSDHLAALRAFPRDSRLAATDAKSETFAYFSECSHARDPKAWSKICTGDFIINLVNSVRSRPAGFDWPTVQTRFAEGLALALSNSANTWTSPDSFRLAPIGYELDGRASSPTPSYGLTASGLLYQFGSDNLGANLMGGVKVEPDIEKALRLYQRAADAGEANAQIMLGFAYKTGSGVPKNNEEAIRFFRKAEAQVPAAELLERQAASSDSLTSR